jgi:hypothetical protein
VALIALLIALVLSGVAPARAAGEESATELAKKTQNPVADLISVPFQSNFNFGAGTKDATVYVLNVQPVVPFHLTHEWNLITRTIVPIINQPSPAPTASRGARSGWGTSIRPSSSRRPSPARSSGG